MALQRSQRPEHFFTLSHALDTDSRCTNATSRCHERIIGQIREGHDGNFVSILEHLANNDLAEVW
jgi:hypothetical protein